MDGFTFASTVGLIKNPVFKCCQQMQQTHHQPRR
jgi:hypothetical protein